jgi:hypothetical protein
MIASASCRCMLWADRRSKSNDSMASNGPQGRHRHCAVRHAFAGRNGAMTTTMTYACCAWHANDGAIDALLSLQNRRGVPSMVLDPRRHAIEQGTESGGDFSFDTAPAAADTGPVAAGQSQQRQLDAQLAQAAGNGALTAQGQLARLPAMQQPRPAAEEWWPAMHANFTATVKVCHCLVEQ